ncbi:MAG: F0F1 ATP synthase subunit delta [Candidatus Omnitrophica bacterium]|nr:F0F1 ATP synthase subunit delta [Candidatus Omnitrophota bacterium]
MLIKLIIIQIITFLIILIVLKKLLYTETAKEIERLKKLKEEFTHKEKELQVRIASTQESITQKMAKAEEDVRIYREAKKKEAESLKQEILAGARDRAEETIKAAVNSREKIREEIMLEMKGRLPAAAAGIFKEALSAEMVEFVHGRLVSEAVSRIKKMDKNILKGKSGKGELISAYPLKKSERDNILSAVSERAGREAALAERDDKALIAGVIVKFGSLVIDGSLENRLKQAEERLG